MKKYFLVGTIIFSCNQQMYDSIYKAILQMTLNAPEITQKGIDYKNDTIENLRKLCNGQKSSYEK
jgi:hypothetical protein